MADNALRDWLEHKTITFVAGSPWQRRVSYVEPLAADDDDPSRPMIERMDERGYVCPISVLIGGEEIFAFDVDTSSARDGSTADSVKLQAEIIATALNDLLAKRGWQKMGLEFLVPEIERYVPHGLTNG